MAVVYDARLGGHAVTLIGIESRPLPRHGVDAGRRPGAVVGGHAVPAVVEEGGPGDQRGQRRAGRSSMLANLSGFDGSPESLRRLQLEYGAEIGRAIVNFDGPFVLCVVSRYHGGAFVVFSATLNDDMEVLAVEGSFASVIGGAPAAAVVFTRDVDERTERRPAGARRSRPRSPTPRRTTPAAVGPSWPSCATRCAPRSSARSPPSSTPSTASSGPRTSARCTASSPPRDLRPELIAAVERGMASYG